MKPLRTKSNLIYFKTQLIQRNKCCRVDYNRRSVNVTLRFEVHSVHIYAVCRQNVEFLNATLVAH